MKNQPLKIILSKFDEKRFGIRTAHAANITQENLREVMDFCKANQVVFLVARCETNQLRAVHSMQREGFLLMDTLIRYSVEVDKIAEAPDIEMFPVLPVQAGEEDAVRAVALEVFRGFRSHYHADERLNPEKCDGIYASIACEACLNKEKTSIVHVCKIDGEIVGFDILNSPSLGVGEGVLKAIALSVQKQGVGHSFASPKKAWYQSQGALVAFGPTQITNIAAQKQLISQNYLPYDSIYTFHKWFD
ncbi:MAG: hypothetical protein FVQ83_15180 [Chloroflexi bacterium]|nr:hypothetical protein [Chloroflexota bacterium]